MRPPRARAARRRWSGCPWTRRPGLGPCTSPATRRPRPPRSTSPRRTCSWRGGVAWAGPRTSARPGGRRGGPAGEVARALGGEVAATRAVVDAGWYPYAAQVGQTGKTVSPRLYVACGISGAIQHKVGMQGSGVVIAINKDPNAAIFEYSDLGVVGDLHQVVPKLTELVRQRKAA